MTAPIFSRSMLFNATSMPFTVWAMDCVTLRMVMAVWTRAATASMRDARVRSWMRWFAFRTEVVAYRRAVCGWGGVGGRGFFTLGRFGFGARGPRAGLGVY